MQQELSARTMLIDREYHQFRLVSRDGDVTEGLVHYAVGRETIRFLELMTGCRLYLFLALVPIGNMNFDKVGVGFESCSSCRKKKLFPIHGFHSLGECVTW